EEIALVGLLQLATGADDIAKIEALDQLQLLGAQALAVDVELNLSRHILDHEKGAAISHQPTGHSHRNGQSLEVGLLFLAKLRLQSLTEVAATEGVAEAIAWA